MIESSGTRQKRALHPKKSSREEIVSPLLLHVHTKRGENMSHRNLFLCLSRSSPLFLQDHKINSLQHTSCVFVEILPHGMPVGVWVFV